MKFRPSIFSSRPEERRKSSTIKNLQDLRQKESFLLNCASQYSGSGKLNSCDEESFENASEISRRHRCGGFPFAIVNGIILIVVAVSSLIYNPMDLIIDLKLEMSRGLPPFEIWKSPPPNSVLCKVYIFNVTNAEDFLSGKDEKIRFQEIGPIIYQERLIHSNISHNSNGTLTYVATRYVEYAPELNTYNLNDTLVVPNTPFLLIPSYLHNAPFYVKLGMNLLIRNYDPKPFVNISIYNFLWNFTDPILVACHHLAPKMVPKTNVGLLNELYHNFVGTYNVYIGKEHGHEKFFLMDRFDGSEVLESFEGNCKPSIKYGTEGVCYPQRLTKNETLLYWRRSVCKLVALKYSNEELIYGLKASKYIIDPKSYYREKDLDKDCYKGNPILPNGIIDVSPCYYNVPFAVSFPHFLFADESINKNIEGLKPNKDVHMSYIYIEPLTGTPLKGKAMSQSNLVIRNFTGFNQRLERLKGLTLPQMWIEYEFTGAAWYVKFMLHLLVNILPYIQTPVAIVTVICGVLLVIYYFRKRKIEKNQDYFAQNLTDSQKIETVALFK